MANAFSVCGEGVIISFALLRHDRTERFCSGSHRIEFDVYMRDFEALDDQTGSFGLKNGIKCFGDTLCHGT